MSQEYKIRTKNKNVFLRVKNILPPYTATPTTIST